MSDILTVDDQPAGGGDGYLVNLTLVSLAWSECVEVEALSDRVQETCPILGPTQGKIQLRANPHTQHLGRGGGWREREGREEEREKH